MTEMKASENPVSLHSVICQISDTSITGNFIFDHRPCNYTRETEIFPFTDFVVKHVHISLCPFVRVVVSSLLCECVSRASLV